MVGGMTITSARLAPGDLDDLARAVHGRVAGPGQPAWEQIRRGWNLSVDVQPAAVVDVADEADVAAALRFAAAYGVPVSAQGSGHGVTRALDGAVVLRTHALRSLEIDVDRRVARFGAGLKWQRLNETLTGTGLTGLPGSTGDISVAGYHLGGGLSWFVRRHGLAAHAVRAVDLVDARGEPTRITGADDPDLWWALRGAGGDLGIATAVEIDLLPLDGLYGGRVLWAGEHAAKVFARFVEATQDPPEELTLWAWLLNFPDLPDVPEPMRGRWSVALDCTYLGSPDEGRVMVDAALAGLPRPLLDSRRELRLAELAGIAAEPTEPTPIHEDLMMVDRFGAEEAATLLETVGVGETSALTVLEVRHLGGALRRQQPGQGIAGTVPQPYAVVLGGIVPTPEAAEEARAVGTTVRAALANVDSGMMPPNFGPLERRNLTDADLARLQAVKASHDPRGTIRSARPIPLPPHD